MVNCISTLKCLPECLRDKCRWKQFETLLFSIHIIGREHMLNKTKAAALSLPVQTYKVEIEVFASLSYYSGSYIWGTEPCFHRLSVQNQVVIRLLLYSMNVSFLIKSFNHRKTYEPWCNWLGSSIHVPVPMVRMVPSTTHQPVLLGHHLAQSRDPMPDLPTVGAV